MITDYDVIIVGGGPTGVALGIELGLHDIRTLILEKHKAPLLSPRAMSLNTRSMEFFRRWQISDQLKQEILLPPDYPIRGVWCSKLNGKTYATVSSNDLITDDISPERGIRIPLWLTEKVLRKRLEDFSSVKLLKKYTAINLTFDTHKINVVAKHGKEKTFTAPFVVGCDGANSITRVKAGIPFEALAPSSRVINIVFEAKHIERLITVEQGFLYYLLESDTPGAIGPVDLKQGIWYAQIRDTSQIDKIEDLDLLTLLDNMAGFSFEKHIIQAHFWQMHIQMAQEFSSKDNRVFLVGDSAHAFVPTGGFGLNTGLGDATNLGWKLAQVIKGYASKTLLKSYEEERRPVCLNNLTLAQKNADDLMSLRKKYNPKESPEAFAKANVKLANQYVSALDATLGYRYGTYQQIERTQRNPYNSIVAAGYFLAHRWLDGNLSIYDKLSAAHWTLIVSGQVPEDDLKRLSDFKLDVLKLPKDTYHFYYVLVRPDWHIAYVSDHFIIMHILNVISHTNCRLYPATLLDHPLIQRMWLFYIYDIGQECGFINGWECPTKLSFVPDDITSYFNYSTRRAYLIRVDDETAGFALLNQAGTLPNTQWNMGEFFILAKFQGKGVGTEIAHQLWNMHSGRWEVSVIPENKSALAFWRKVISKFTCSRYIEVIKDVDYDQNQPKRYVFSFDTKKL